MASVIWIVFAGLFLAGALADASSYRIPNWISVVLAALFVLAALASGVPVLSYWPHLALALGVLLVGYLLYLFTGMGAGDAKLGAVAVLWAGVPGLYAWTFFLALAMAVLALALVAVRRISSSVVPSGSKLRLLRRGEPVPLGVAIAAAAILASGRFDPALWPI